MKPTIRKAGTRWVLTRPAFGFACSDEVTLHESWKAARAALLGEAVGSAGPVIERASGVQRMSYPPRGQQIRMGSASGRKCACGNWQPCPNPACAPPKMPPPPPPPPPPPGRGTIRMEDR